MGIDLWALLGTGIIFALAYGLYRLYRAAQKALQGHYDQGYVAGRVVGQKESSRLSYTQGHEDGLVEGRAQAGKELTISAEKAFERGYEHGQLDLLVLATLEQAEQLRGNSPTMTA